MLASSVSMWQMRVALAPVQRSLSSLIARSVSATMAAAEDDASATMAANGQENAADQNLALPIGEDCPSPAGGPIALNPGEMMAAPPPPNAMAPIDIPPCPYKEGDDVSDGIPCYWPGCKYHAKIGAGYDLVMSHVKIAHKQKMSSFKGTYFYDKATEVGNAKQNVRKQQARNHNKEKAREPGASARSQAAAAFAVDGAAAPAAADSEDNRHAPAHVPPAYMWKPIQCWVKCGADGTPTQPLEVGGFASDPKPVDQVPQPLLWRFQCSACDYLLSCLTQEAASNAATQRCPNCSAPFEQAGKEDALDQLVGISPADKQGALAKLVESPPGNAPPASALEMVAGMYAMPKDMNPDKAQWMKELPTLAVKQKYKDEPPPVAQGEDDCERATWPKALGNDKIPTPQFEHYLKQLKNKKKGQAKVLLGNVGKVLGMLEVDGQSLSMEQASDVKVLVAFYQSGVYQEFFDMDLCRPCYYWTLTMVDSLVAFCKFHMREVSHKSLRGEQGHWQNYTAVLTQMIVDLQDGVRARCVEAKNKKMSIKAKADLKRIKALCTVAEMQAAVKTAYLVLKQLAEEYKDWAELPPKVRGLVNTILVGACWLDTFGGRKMEWEILTLAHVLEQLEAGLKFIICSTHKTSPTYGDLCKLLTPGLWEAFKVAAALPRPDGVETFFVPVTSTADTIDVPSYMKAFCKKFLPQVSAKRTPKVNIMRKWFHRELMKMTADAEKLKDVMTILDAHSKAIANKHYFLKDPEDDAILAALLVKSVLGDTVQWPTDEELRTFLAGQDDLAKLLEEALDADGVTGRQEDEEDEEEDDDDVELEWWEAAGTFFGVPQPGIEQLQAIGDHDHMVPIDDPNVESVPDHAKWCARQRKFVVPDADGASPNVAAASNGDASLLVQIHQHLDQSLRLAGPSPPAEEFANKKRKKYSPAEIAELDKYACTALEGTGNRMKVDPPAHDWMRGELGKWQAENSKGELEQPSGKDWYVWKRIELIKMNLLSTLHHRDIVKSYLDSQIRMKKKSMPLEAPVEQTESRDID
jgi:hypothetical protein